MNTYIFELVKSPNSLAGLIMRLTLAVVIFPHGAQFLLGWFQGPGYTGSMTFLKGMGLPAVVAFMVIIIQFFGPLFLVAGLAVRPLALMVIVLFLGMIITSHLSHGFFMNWSGTQKGEGYEYHILVIGLAFALVINGGGAWSIDKRIEQNMLQYLQLTVK